VIVDFEEHIDAYEAALVKQEATVADITEFLPPAGAVNYYQTLVELLRITLEHHWQPGSKHAIDKFREQFPDLFESPQRLEPLAFEEYRLRCGDGAEVSKAEYVNRYGIDVSRWPDFGPLRNPSSLSGSANDQESWQEFSRSEPASAAQSLAARRTLPQVGEQFGSFALVALLGEGAFGRVFLARQQNLSQRLVALKITFGRPTEAQKLARLQHGNIMPVYSVHRRGKLSAICMPYLGSITLADLIACVKRQGSLPRSAESLVKTVESRRAELSTVVHGQARMADQAEMPIQQVDLAQLRQSLGSNLETYFARCMQQVAAGLEQAHDRGIVHRDLKPANILISDNGEPLLLDFNLAAEQAEIGKAAHEARIGGTLPYMSPEQLRQFQGDQQQPLGGISDLYALGVVLYECLTAQHPFPIRRGNLEATLQQMIADRQSPPPDVRQLNPAVSPALSAIVQRCLQPDPQHRYQRASQACEDLQRHLENRPLRYAPNPSFRELAAKWCRRHPRLSSISTVLTAALLFATFAGAVWYSREAKLADKVAVEELQHNEDLLLKARSLLLIGGPGSNWEQQGIGQAEQALHHYRVLTDDKWYEQQGVRRLSAEQRKQLGIDVAEVLWLLAQREEQAGAKKLQGLAAVTWQKLVKSPLPRLDTSLAESLSDSEVILSLAANKRGELVPQAEQRLRQLTQQRPKDAFAWIALAHFYRKQQQYPLAESAANAAVALRSDLELTWQLRGMVHLAQKRWLEAEEDFSRALELPGGGPDALFNRGIARQEQGRHAAAIEDFTAAIAAGFTETRVYFSRARSYQAQDDAAHAATDRQQGQRLIPQDALSFIARGLSFLPQDPEAALQDLEAAVALEPWSRIALMNLAHVQAEHLDQTASAIGTLALILKLNPRDTDALGSRAVLFARGKQADEAQAELKQLMQVEVRPPLAIYQAACVYALLGKDQPQRRIQALQLLATALATQPSLVHTARTDSDLANLHGERVWNQLVPATSPATKP
jgi:serine/threonine protein kinase/tetratricopeptide (TPR) repeat protein